MARVLSPLRPSALPTRTVEASVEATAGTERRGAVGRWRTGFVAVLLLVVSCTDAGEPVTSPSLQPQRGGTLRLALVGDLHRTSEGWVAELDPQRTYHWPDEELFRCCLLRTLFSYSGLLGAEGGTPARPDLTSGPPEVSAGGLIWTIRIRDGIRYAPPLQDVEVATQDIVRALMRSGTPRTYADYYY